MALPRQVIDTESALGIDNGAIQSAIPLGIAPSTNEIVYIDD